MKRVYLVQSDPTSVHHLVEMANTKGYSHNEIAIFCRSYGFLQENVDALRLAGYKVYCPGENCTGDEAMPDDHIRAITMCQDTPISIQCVIIIGVSEGILPPSSVIDQKIEEERRMFHAACDSAKYMLVVSPIYGANDSRFLDKAPRIHCIRRRAEKVRCEVKYSQEFERDWSNLHELDWIDCGPELLGIEVLEKHGEYIVSAGGKLYTKEELYNFLG